MRKLFFFLALFIGSLQSMAQPETDFEKANVLYQRNDFEGAIQRYNNIIAEGYEHVETYYNLGNAHFRLGNLGLAILNYEKAQKLNPKDEDVLHNLELANKQVVDEFNVVPTPALQRIFRDVSGVFSSTVWSFIGLFFFGLMLIFTVLFLFVNRKTYFLTLVLLSFILGVANEAMAFGRLQVEQEQFAVLTAPNSYVKSAPADGAEDLFILHEGTKVKVLDEFSGWQKIKLPDGKIGWINADGLSLI